MNSNNIRSLIESGRIFTREDFIFFWSGRKLSKVTKNCFSQWYPSKFIVGGKEYQFAEQFMMAKKAELFNDVEILPQIMMASDARTIKRLGREVKNFDPAVWNEKKFEIVVQGNLAKFSQNHDLRDFILSTGDRILVEASPYDKIWGIGMNESSQDAIFPERWKGQNLLGFALMKVRAILDNLMGQEIKADAPEK